MKAFLKCRVCGFEGESEKYSAKEMMFGWKDPFDYFQCEKCECLQIEKIPENIARYYPEEYNAYHAAQPMIRSTGLKKVFRLWRNRQYLKKSKIYDLFLKKAAPFYEAYPGYLRDLDLRPESRILDIGCGDGELLMRLQVIGFKNLTGMEPFQKEPLRSISGVRIYKKTIEEMEGKFDLVMLHHVFEHMPDPHIAFRKIDELLVEDGTCLIRIPTVSSYAWEKYGVNWVTMDPPRHFYLHSLKSVEYLAARYGFNIRHIAWDADGFQFWGSEQYLKGIPLMTKTKRGTWFQPALPELEEKVSFFNQEAARLNAEKRGDCIQVFMTKRAKI